MNFNDSGLELRLRGYALMREDRFLDKSANFR